MVVCEVEPRGFTFSRKTEQESMIEDPGGGGLQHNAVCEV